MNTRPTSSEMNSLGGPHERCDPATLPIFLQSSVRYGGAASTEVDLPANELDRKLRTFSWGAGR